MEPREVAAKLRVVPGTPVEYYSASLSRRVPARILAVDPVGEVQVDVKKHVWVQPSEFEKKMRASASGRVMHVISCYVEDKPFQYFSAPQGIWGTRLEMDETMGKLRLAAHLEKPIVAQPTEEHDALFSEVDDAIADVLRNGDVRLVSGLWPLKQMEQAFTVE